MHWYREVRRSTLAGVSCALLFAISWGTSPGQGEELAATLFDGFDGQLKLNWKPVRPDPTQVSLVKNSGKLTITTQIGTLGLDEKASGRVPAKNLYLIPNPVAVGGDFVLTTCVESFQPTTNYQQAGLLIYDDDDNYLKCDMEWNQTRVYFKFIHESNQRRTIITDSATPSSNRTWIRIIKRGTHYERAYSIDGKAFISSGEVAWGNGTPKSVGILAQNGIGQADNIDACFDFFEVRPLTDTEKNNPNYVDRKRMRGNWEVVSCQLGGKPMEDASISQFAFDDSSVTIKEKSKTMRTGYALDATKEPKRLVLSTLSSQANRPVNGIYSLDGENLVICLALKQGAPAPTELASKEGDSQMLITLRRATD